jgi:hypothetical protein
LIGRRLGRRRAGAGLEPAALRDLARANRLMEVGQHANAAAIFERLGREALDHNAERQAPFLLLQAGRARLLAGNAAESEALLREGLDWLARQGRWLTLRRAGRRVAEDLRRLGQPGLAQELSASLEGTSQGEEEAGSAPARPRLPLQCPHCGAPARPDEVEWFEDGSAECAYCGGIIQA